MSKSVHPLPELAAEVARLSAAGLTAAQVSVLTDTAERTLERHYAAPMAKGRLGALAKVGSTLFQLAQSGNLGACCFLAKTQLGWREIQRTEVTAADGAPLNLIAPPAAVMMIPCRDPQAWREQVVESQRQLIAKHGGPRA